MELVGGVSTYQEEILINHPMLIFLYIGLLPTAVFSVSLVYIYMKRENLGDFDILALLWVIVLTALIPIYPDRFATYAIVPMSIISSRFLGETDKFNKRVGLTLRTTLFLLALVTYVGWWYVLGGSGGLMFDIK